ncbi:MAG TPA: hypothetical protein VFO00_13830 [Vitreimonas sp.]|nr:hypothetical protein [Vitreimonas sp.]
MRVLLVASLLAIAAACSPPAETKTEAPAPVAEEPAAPAVDLGPYTNSWDSDQFSRFRHTLNSAAPGSNSLTLTAQTNAGGGETVAVYPIGPDGERRTVRLIFVVADVDGTAGTETVDIPAEGLPVEVVVENAGGRRHAGNYSLTVGASAP